MFSRSAVRPCVWVSAAIFVSAVVLPTNAWTQSRKSGPTHQVGEKKFSVESAAGITLPASSLGDIADPGPNVGLQVGYAVSRRLALNVIGDVDFLNGAGLSAGAQAPDMRLWHYGAGLDASLLQAGAAARWPKRWSLRANIGVGATTFDTDKFSVGAQERSFNHTYFTTGGGLRLGYAVSSRLNTYVSSRAYWMAMNKKDTEVLAALDPDKVRAFDSGWTFPVTAGFSLRM